MSRHPGINETAVAGPLTARVDQTDAEAGASRWVQHLRQLAPVVLVGAGWYATMVWGYWQLMIPAAPRLAVIWPPNAILLAGLLAGPARVWWMYLLAAAAAQLAGGWTVGVELGRQPGMFAGDAAQALLAAIGMYRWGRGLREFETLRGMTVFVAVAVLLAPAVASLISALLLLRGGWIDDPVLYWRVRFVTNMATMLTLGPPLLVALVRPAVWRRPADQRWTEFVALAAALLAAEVVARRFVYPISLAALIYVPLPFLLWAAVRFGPAGVGLVLLVNTLVHFLAGFDSAWDASMSSSDAVLSLQLALIAVTLPLLFLAVLFEERRRVEAALRESQLRYNLATSAGAVGVWDWDPRTDATFVDPVVKELLGFKDDEIANTRLAWMDRIQPEEGDLSKERLQSLVEGKASTYELERRMLHRDGSVRWFLERGAVVERDRHGRVLRIVGTATDITERKRAEDALRESAASLAHTERKTEMGEVAAAIAHEVSQPLAAIVANASACLRWIVRGATDTPDVRQALADVMADGKRAGEVIQRMRELFQRRELERVPVVINDLIRHALAASRAKLSRVYVQLELPEHLPDVLADPIQLQQVVNNLVANAVDAMRASEGRRMVLVVRAMAEAPGGVRVSVQDAGVGITPEALERLFEPFFTTKKGGMGIGLAVCRSIIEAHGGKLWATTNEGGGATFHFSLPALAEQA